MTTINKSLARMLDEMELRALDGLQLHAVSELREELAEQAARQPCVRCSHAGWITYWSDNKDPSKRRFYTRLATCGAFHSLPRFEDELGFDIPIHFFCTAEASAPGQKGG
ncbi:hypothetical protein [Hydrogenophaga sp. 2FB]|uniref:hypothetical protein n=1 Tax=Hydrogenophaga sp. 2FB TaxID=2502187 RepID=UPI0010F57846|nr:hypothetical protein [Hydrogenophaga sp. 2FB]